MKIDVADPEAGWYVLNDELQGGLWSLGNIVLEEVQDGVAWFNKPTVFAFPMRERSVPSFDVALAENMVKDVFYINELIVQFKELDGRCMLVVMVRSKMVRNPKLRCTSHDEKLVQTSKV